MKIIKKYISDALLMLGCVFITAGIFLYSVPAGLIATGLSFIAWAYILAKAKGGG
jgi:hypothetical protein